MAKNQIQLFEDRRIRTSWNEKEEKWYFSIVDVVAVLTDNEYQAARNYWKVLKSRLLDEGNESVTNCNRLKLPASDGKMRLTDVADLEQQLGRSVISSENADDLRLSANHNEEIEAPKP